MTYLVQVQHKSDLELDGIWYTLDTVNDERSAQKACIHFYGLRLPKLPDGRLVPS